MSGQHIILLTVVHKTKRRETAKVNRAKRAMQRCKDEQHTAEEDEWPTPSTDTKNEPQNPNTRAAYDRARRAYESAEQVRTLRERAGISQAELAPRMGTSQPAVAPTGRQRNAPHA